MRSRPRTTASQLASLIASLEGYLDDRMPLSEAERRAEAFLRLWPHPPQRADLKAYGAAIVALLTAHPRGAVEEVVHPVRGLASRCRYFPTIAEVSEALEEAAREPTRTHQLCCALLARLEHVEARRVGNIVCDTVSGADQVRAAIAKEG